MSLRNTRTRAPAQARSRARVERLVAAADRILATDGYGALTIARLAKDAGVPVGTFYQFFADKHAIVETVAGRYAGMVAAVVDGRREAIVALPIGERLPAAFDAIVAFHRTHPAYRALRAARHTTHELTQAEDANVTAMVDSIKAILRAGRRVRDETQLDTAARALERVVDALLDEVFALRDRGDRKVIAASKALLGACEQSAAKQLFGRTRRR